MGVDEKHQHMTGVSFPVSDDALRKLGDLRDGKITYVQLVSYKFEIVEHYATEKIYTV